MQGDTLDNVEKELDSVIDTGIYTFCQEEVDELGRNKAQLFLEFEPASIQLPAESTTQAAVLTSNPNTQDRSGSGRKELWNQEKIADFVRKLGFVDKNKKGDKIKYFLHLNQVYTITSSKLHVLIPLMICFLYMHVCRLSTSYLICI